MRRIFAIAALVGAFLLYPMLLAPAQAEIYKWTDDSGAVHYGQVPPPDREAERVNPKVSTGSAGERPDPQTRAEALDKEREEQKAAEQEAAEQAQARARLEAACESARRDLKTLRTRTRILLKSGDEYRALSEEERQKHIQKATTFLEENCQDL